MLPWLVAAVPLALHHDLLLQLSTVRQELAVKAAELSHTGTALQEQRETLAHTRSQLAAVQDNLSGQLRAVQRELAAAQAEKQQGDREIGRLTQEGAFGRVGVGVCSNCRVLSTFPHAQRPVCRTETNA